MTTITILLCLTISLNRPAPSPKFGQGHRVFGFNLVVSVRRYVNVILLLSAPAFIESNTTAYATSYRFRVIFSLLFHYGYIVDHPSQSLR